MDVFPASAEVVDNATLTDNRIITRWGGMVEREEPENPISVVQSESASGKPTRRGVRFHRPGIVDQQQVDLNVEAAVYRVPSSIRGTV